jgi:hypothetical protein
LLTLTVCWQFVDSLLTGWVLVLVLSMLRYKLKYRKVHVKSDPIKKTLSPQ